MYIVKERLDQRKRPFRIAQNGIFLRLDGAWKYGMMRSNTFREKGVTR